MTLCDDRLAFWGECVRVCGSKELKMFYISIPSPKSVNLKGLREVRRVVVYHNDNSKPPGSPHGHFSTFAMSPARYAQHNAASMQPDCYGDARHDWSRHDVWILTLDGAM